jgi:glycosyltransferase involved in cell wall biosynthesis
MSADGCGVPTIDRLPSPPPGKAGWPWTEASAALPGPGPDGHDWPRISIVTPTLNQGQFIEETIRSVLLQGYPNLEYFIFDAGSKDGTVELIRKYEPWLTFWASEPDRGQTHAINKGLAKSSGVLFNWLNSDDQLVPGALAIVARQFLLHHPHFVAGEAVFVEPEARQQVNYWRVTAPRHLGDFVPPISARLTQPATFMNRQLIDQLGGFREELHYVMDYEFYLRAAIRLGKEMRIGEVPQLLATIISHPAAKTVALASRVSSEWRRVLCEYRDYFPRFDRYRLDSFMRRHYCQELVNSRAGVPQLLALIFNRPDMLLYRFFWGAVRRALVHR